MVKYANHQVVFREVYDEVSLAINITNCPCRCSGCHSKYLWEDNGIPLTFEELDTLIKENNGITCVCFMGGDAEPSYINILASYMRENHKGLLVAWYSGVDTISPEIEVRNFDFIKTGPYIEAMGPLNRRTTNQKMFRVVDGELEDVTYKYWP